jgi:uncharacterized protein YfdQ (DUF2303 family)
MASTVDISVCDPAPPTTKSDTLAQTVDGFVQAVLLQTEPAALVSLYVDLDGSQLTAVLNDNAAPDVGWRDHTVSLKLTRSESWKLWTRNAGLERTLEQLADVIDKGYRDIIDPSAADMLELAQSFEVATDGQFSAGTRLQSGARTLVWKENATARAAGGTIEVPDHFTISVIPFIGGEDRQDVECKLRFKLRPAGLQIGYLIHDVVDVERAGFADAASRVDAKLRQSRQHVTTIEGYAPEARR